VSRADVQRAREQAWWSRGRASAEGVFGKGPKPVSGSWRKPPLQPGIGAGRRDQKGSRESPSSPGFVRGMGSRSGFAAVGRLMATGPNGRQGWLVIALRQAAPGFRCRSVQRPADGVCRRLPAAAPGVGAAVVEGSSSQGGRRPSNQPGSRNRLKESGRRQARQAARRGSWQNCWQGCFKAAIQRSRAPAGCRHRPVPIGAAARTAQQESAAVENNAPPSPAQTRASRKLRIATKVLEQAQLVVAIGRSHALCLRFISTRLPAASCPGRRAEPLAVQAESPRSGLKTIAFWCVDQGHSGPHLALQIESGVVLLHEACGDRSPPSQKAQLPVFEGGIGRPINHHSKRRGAPGSSGADAASLMKCEAHPLGRTPVGEVASGAHSRSWASNQGWPLCPAFQRRKRSRWRPTGVVLLDAAGAWKAARGAAPGPDENSRQSNFLFIPFRALISAIGWAC